MQRPKAIHLRRLSQILFLTLFLALFLKARDPLSGGLPPDLLLRLDPLAGLVVSVAQRAIIAAFWPALIILLLTFLLGRSFCGWVCPLGTTLDLWNRIAPHRRGDRRWKYAVLTAVFVLAFLSLQAVWLLDPLVIFNRTLTLAFYPLTLWGLNGIFGAAFNWSWSEGPALAISDLLQGWFLPIKPFQTATLTLTAAIFIGILLLDRFGRRFWCRVLCPLGAMLGLISHHSPFGRKVESRCSDCALCGSECRMAAIEDQFTHPPPRMHPLPGMRTTLP
jgi:polyferredoxin